MNHPQESDPWNPTPEHSSDGGYYHYYTGDTDEEMEMESAPTAAAFASESDPILVSDGEDDEEEAGGHDPPEAPEPTEEVTWKVYTYRQDGRGIPMADYLRAMAYRLGYVEPPAYQCELWTHPWFEPHWEVTTIMYEKEPFLGLKEISRHKDVANMTTIEAGIAEAARRALYVLSH